MIFRVLLYAFLFYLLYKIVFELVIPVHKTSQQLKKDFREMQERMSGQMNTEESSEAPSPKKTSSSKVNSDDYIEFEEIK